MAAQNRGVTPEMLREIWDLVEEEVAEQDKLHDEARAYEAGLWRHRVARDPIGERFWNYLDMAGRISQQFEKEFGREPSDVELRIAASLFIEANERERPRYSGKGGPPKPALPSAPEDVKCPKCGGPMEDQSTTKKNPKAPDYLCADKSCKTGDYRTGVWKKAA